MYPEREKEKQSPRWFEMVKCWEDLRAVHEKKAPNKVANTP